MSNFINFYQKNRKIILIITWILAIIIICSFSYKSIKSHINYTYSQEDFSIQKEDFYKSQSFKANKIKEIDIRLISEKITIQATEGSEIEIELYGNWKKKNEAKISYKNDILTIIQKNKQNFNISNRFILVKIPSHLLSENTKINIEIISGSCELSDILIKEISIESVSGRSFLKNIECKEASLENVSGRIQIENSSINEVETECVSGSIDIEGMFDEISCNSVSGRIIVNNKKDFDRDCEFSTISGSIKIYLPSTANAELDCSSGSGTSFNEFTGTKSKKLKEKIGSGKYELEAESISGSIEIRKN